MERQLASKALRECPKCADVLRVVNDDSLRNEIDGPVKDWSPADWVANELAVVDRQRTRLQEGHRDLRRKCEAMERDTKAIGAINDRGWSVTFAVYGDCREFAVWTTGPTGLASVPLACRPTLTDAALAALEAKS